MSIELKELAGYLPYELKIYHSSFMFKSSLIQPEIGVMIGITDIIINDTFDIIMIREKDKYKLQDSRNHFKPILHPLSDLTKEIEHNGERFVPYKAIEDLFGVENFSVDLTYQVRREDDGLVYISLEKQNEILQKLHEWHFDLHYWIEQGLAIDINTLDHA